MPSDEDLHAAAGPPLELPERLVFGPEDMATVAVSMKLSEMLEGTDAGNLVLALDMRALALAALTAVDGLPRVPRWTEARQVGGATRGGGLPEPQITVDVAGSQVAFLADVVTLEDGQTRQVIGTAQVPPADARTWALAVLAACDAAELGEGAAHGQSG
jgi:hypothetical protein